ncbi:MAG TPA: 4'-phosphopantetheinyl transferase superfamily protein [Rhizomicrobium sp.]
MARLLSPGLFGAEVVDRGQDAPLDPAEAVHVAKAGESRRRDFALGRACARAALAGLGHGDAVISIGAGGAPVWPPGIVGSITHTRGYAAALAADEGLFRALGLDAERIGGVAENLFPRLFTPQERAGLAALDGAARAETATLFFSAKEAFFKTGLAGTRLSFHDIAVARTRDGFLANGHPGRFAVGNGLLLAALAIAV